jgi:hypothetical protein
VYIYIYVCVCVYIYIYIHTRVAMQSALNLFMHEILIFCVVHQYFKIARFPKHILNISVCDSGARCVRGRCVSLPGFTSRHDVTSATLNLDTQTADYVQKKTFEHRNVAFNQPSPLCVFVRLGPIVTRPATSEF